MESLSFVFSYHENWCLDNIALHRFRVFHPLLLVRQTWWTDWKEDGWRRRGEMEGWKKWWWWLWLKSCPVMRGGEVGAHWSPSSLSFHPFLILASWKVSKRRDEFGFEAAQQWTLPPITLTPLHYRYIVTPGAGSSHNHHEHLRSSKRCGNKGCLIRRTSQRQTTGQILTNSCLSLFSGLCLDPDPGTDTETSHANFNRKYPRRKCEIWLYTQQKVYEYSGESTASNVAKTWTWNCS